MTDQSKIPDEVMEAAVQVARLFSIGARLSKVYEKTLCDGIAEAFRDFVRVPGGGWYYRIPDYEREDFEGSFPSYDEAVKAAEGWLITHADKDCYSLTIYFIAEEEVTAPQPQESKT